MAVTFDETDLLVLHALQVAPRAPWTRVADVIGVDAGTAARHWAALSEQRLAWLGVWPTPERWADVADVAVVRVRPGAGRFDDTVRRLCADPDVHSVDETSAGLVAFVTGTGGLPALAAHVRALAGDEPAETHHAMAVHREDSRWRLRVLSAAQQRRLADPHEPLAGATVSEAAVAEVAAALLPDVRQSFAALGRRLGVSETTARRQVERMTRAGLLRLGCDLSMPAAGLGRGALLRARARHSEALAGVLRSPSVHRVAEVVAGAPLLVEVRAASLTELTGIERGWAGVEVVDRESVVRPHKRNGHVLDEQGRRA